VNTSSSVTRDAFQSAARKFRAGRLSLEEFTLQILCDSPPTKVDAPSGGDRVNLDLQRQARCGFPEVILGFGKSTQAIETAVRGLLNHGQPVLITRIEPTAAQHLLNAFSRSRYEPSAQTLAIDRCPPMRGVRIAVVTAGTSDYSVAAEALETLFWMGVDAFLIQDIGVAGPQRLIDNLPQLRNCHVVIVVAGFEGALPSVIAGHLGCPVIAVPTSRGLGLHGQGLVPLLAMLNSCAANVTVVNIDAGFKAGYLAGHIAKQIFEHGKSDASIVHEPSLATDDQ
jgi:NCAIR mutase (PurE)-related protein